jgi:hypothetical protein
MYQFCERLTVLLTSDVSSYVTGQIFVQDGGQLAKVRNVFGNVNSLRSL